MSEYIGHICLNIALILYLFHYVPQLIHNRNAKNKAQLNLHYHGLLTICYFSDLIFAFGMNMPWQYCLVSTVGAMCLLIQHFQLKALHQQHRLYSSYQRLIAIFFFLFFSSFYFKLPQSFFLAMGYMCQAAVWSYIIPQICHNYINKQGQGLNNIYLGINLACYSLDSIASTTLNWPFPAKLGAIFGLICTMTLIYQMKIYCARSQSVVF